jgi:hypothetical protein
VASISRRSGHGHVQGQILLERALFCVECEVIYTGTIHCPRCGGGAVWPLAEWLGSARPSPRAIMPSSSPHEETQESCGPHALPAA